MKNVSKISIAVSSLGVLTGIWVQYTLYDGYMHASGKTQALYGLQHLQYYYLMSIGGLGCLLSPIAAFLKEQWKVSLLALGLGVEAILLVLLPLWRWFI